MTDRIDLPIRGFLKSVVSRVGLFLSFGIIALSLATLNAETTKTIYNPFTGKLDYITSLSTTATSSLVILNQNSLQSGATFYVSSGTVNGQFAVNGNITTYGDTFYSRGAGLDLIAPNNLGVGYIYNPNNSLSTIFFNAVDGVSTNGDFSAKSLTSTYGITGTTVTVSTVTVNGQIRFNNRNCLETAPDGTCILAMPGVQETFFGYSTNIINNGGVFNTSYGSSAMPYPNTGNFNNCIGNSCMSGTLLSGENNNGMGYASLGSLRAGFYNNGVGGSALNLLQDGSQNTAVGGYASNHLASGSNTTSIGYRAIFWNLASDNLAIGFESGNSSDTANASTNDDHMIFIGTESGRDLAAATTLSNAGAIGWRAYAHKSNSFQVGGQPGSGHEWEVMAASHTAEGGWTQLGTHTKAELGAITPTTAGQQYYCSDCTNDTVAVSTGATRGGFGRATAKGTFPS